MPAKTNNRVRVLRYVTPDDLPKRLRLVALNVADDFCEANDIPDSIGECVVAAADIRWFYKQTAEGLSPIGDELVTWLTKNDCDLAFRY